MSLWRHFSHGLRSLTNRSAADREIADEVEAYLQEAASAFEADGLSPDRARQAAQRQMGSVVSVREQVRSYGWENAVESLAADIRYGARQLRVDRGFALVCILTLALGIGASTAIFSAVNPVLLQSLPYPDANRLLTIWDRGRDGTPVDVTFGTFRELAERTRSFDSLAAMRVWQPTLTGATEAERLDGQRVSASYFGVLGVTPALGRDFTAADDRVRGPQVAIIGNGLWRRRFGGDPAIIGRTMMLDDQAVTVIGVMPPDFENIALPSADVWSPLQYDPSLPVNGREWGHHLRMLGRLRRDASIARARQELDTIARAELAQFPRVAWAALGNGLIARSLQDDVTQGVRPALLIVIGAVALVMALASVNVTSLLLGRSARRREEFAMRAALGAGRTRLLRQFLTESVLLAALGGAAGMVVATAGVRALVALSPPGLPRVHAITVDAHAFTFALLLTTFIGVVVGVMPAWQAAQGFHGSTARSARVIAGGHQRARRVLVMVEVALALVLMVGAGLLLRSLQHLFAISPGFVPARVVTMQVQVSGRRFDRAATHRFFARALEAAERVPGVISAAFTSQLPFGGEFSEFGVLFATEPAEPADRGSPALRYAVTASYFETLGVPLRRGRLLTPHDTTAAPRSALVSESFARKFQSVDVIGQRVHIGPADQPAFEIVGIVGDVRQASLAGGHSDAVYTTPEQWSFADTALWLVVRAQGDAAELVPAIRSAIWSVDKDQPIVRVAKLDDLVAGTAAERRFALRLFEAFGLSALVLAAIGLYGLLSATVAERSREIGIRAALGASRGDIVTMVVRQGMTLTLVGLVVGALMAAVASRGLLTLLFGVTHLDAPTYLGVMVLILLTSAIACVVPARRAAWVDPTVALKLN